MLLGSEFIRDGVTVIENDSNNLDALVILNSSIHVYLNTTSIIKSHCIWCYLFDRVLVCC